MGFEDTIIAAIFIYLLPRMNWRGVFQAASQNKLVGSTKKKKKILSNNLIRTLIMFSVFVVFHHELRNGWMHVEKARKIYIMTT